MEFIMIYLSRIHVGIIMTTIAFSGNPVHIGGGLSASALLLPRSSWQGATFR